MANVCCQNCVEMLPKVVIKLEISSMVQIRRPQLITKSEKKPNAVQIWCSRSLREMPFLLDLNFAEDFKSNRI